MVECGEPGIALLALTRRSSSLMQFRVSSSRDTAGLSEQPPLEFVPVERRIFVVTEIKKRVKIFDCLARHETMTIIHGNNRDELERLNKHPQQRRLEQRTAPSS